MMSEDGFLTLKDRSKDLIISGGSNIYPREVEEVFLLHPKVLEVSIIGRKHADWGEEVVAYVVPRGRRKSINPNSIKFASTISRVSSGPRNISSSRRFQRIATARS